VGICVDIEGLQGHHHRRTGTIAYNMAKSAVINMARARRGLGPRTIQVTALATGFFPSWMPAETVAEHSEAPIEQMPLGKLGGDTDLMVAALLPASDGGAHITGQTIVVDGGATVIGNMEARRLRGLVSMPSSTHQRNR
jgi:NAD(P)-dependent dehydrogenase (short-subunit alcohol dehydrogenase family)